MNAPDSLSLRHLLLHRLPEAEARALEERLMMEEGVTDCLREAENDLLDDYAAGRLEAEDRAGVEKYLLATARDRQRLQIARALRQVQAVPSPSRSSVWKRAIPRGPLRHWSGRIALGAAACMVLVILVVSRMSGTGSETNADLVLLADEQRGGTIRSIAIPTNVARVRLQMEVHAPAGSSTYVISISDQDGRRLYEASGLRPRAAGGYSFLEVSIPSSALRPGTHRVVVTAREAGGRGQPDSSAWQLDLHRP